MGSKTRPLHVIFFPLMSQGHFIPLIDIAKLFALREGVSVSIVTTHLNAACIQPTVKRTQNITLHLLQFPSAEAGLPIGYESFDAFTPEQTVIAFSKALPLLHHPFEQLVERLCPDCIISDMFFTWTVDIGAKFGIPRLVFHGTGFFSFCIGDSLDRYSPHESVATDTEPFLVPNLPHPIELTRSQLAVFVKSQTPFSEIMDKAIDADRRSYGVIMNSFYELEPDYAEYYKEKVRGSIKAWNVGPVSLCNRDKTDMAERGNKAALDPSDCLDWLGSREPGSVIYICFGSMCRFGAAQLMEIALALETSGHPFIWVVRNVDEMTEDDWMPDGFQERMKGKGLIIKGWAPQVMILEHSAVGGFMTHCGWNSVMEGVTAGVPMITWPMRAEQSYNEKLVTSVLGIGVEVGAHLLAVPNGEGDTLVMRSKEIARAVGKLMDGGDEVEERRRRARELSEKAKRAMEKDGSSYTDLDRLIQELRDARRAEVQGV